MRIRELIDRLQELYVQHGDLPVVVLDDQFDSECEATDVRFDSFEFAAQGLKNRVTIK